MAQIIRKNKSNIVETVKWKEILFIYFQCIVLNCVSEFRAMLLRVHSFVKSKLFSNKISTFLFLGYNTNSDKSDKRHRENTISSPQALSSKILGDHKYVKLKNLKFHYVESGPVNGKVILLLHGFPDCWYSWRYQIPVLSTNYRVIALDMKGFNDSDKPLLRYSYRPSIICFELKMFLDALEIKTVNIIGHDLGGLVGWFFALTYPSYVDKIVQIASPHPNFYWELSKTALTTKNWCNMVQLPFLPENKLKNQKDYISKFHPIVNDKDISAGGDSAIRFKIEDHYQTYRYIFNNLDDWSGALNYFRNFIFFRVNCNIMLRSQCVLMIGNQDQNYKLETIVKSGECCVNSSIKIIDGAGHFPHQSHPNQVNRILSKTFDIHLESPEKYLTEKGLVGRMIQKMYGGQ